jgi:ADP-ribose pyrophosphatase
MGFERTGSEQIWQGRIAGVRVDRFRHDDGEEVSREIVTHPGAVAVVACDDHVWLVRQPREPVGDPALLELPAGKLDADGESPLDTAKRELAEEIGKAADRWEHLVSFWSSPGFSDERVHIYLATGLRDEAAEAEENERIEVEAVPLSELDALIDRCEDAKTLVGLLLLRERRRRGDI